MMSDGGRWVLARYLERCWSERGCDEDEDDVVSAE